MFNIQFIFALVIIALCSQSSMAADGRIKLMFKSGTHSMKFENTLFRLPKSSPMVIPTTVFEGTISRKQHGQVTSYFWLLPNPLADVQVEYGELTSSCKSGSVGIDYTLDGYGSISFVCDYKNVGNIKLIDFTKDTCENIEEGRHFKLKFKGENKDYEIIKDDKKPDEDKQKKPDTVVVDCNEVTFTLEGKSGTVDMPNAVMASAGSKSYQITVHATIENNGGTRRKEKSGGTVFSLPAPQGTAISIKFDKESSFTSELTCDLKEKNGMRIVNYDLCTSSAYGKLTMEITNLNDEVSGSNAQRPSSVLFSSVALTIFLFLSL